MPSKLDKNIEDIISLIIDGKTYRDIATKYSCALSTLHAFLSTSEHSARASAALELSAASYANKGEEVLINAEKDKIEIQRARELAQHYRWMAGKRNPKSYGDSSLLKLADNEGGKLYAIFNTDPLQADNGPTEDS